MSSQNELLQYAAAQVGGLQKDVDSVFGEAYSDKTARQGLLLQMIGDSLAKWENQFSTAKKEIEAKLIKGGNAPAWTGGNGNNLAENQRFQIMAQNFLRNLPFEYQLEKLNEMQKSCPFVLADPNCSSSSGPLSYGYADLYRFLGLQLGTWGVAKVRSPKPAYTPQVPPGNLAMDIDGSRYFTNNPFFVPVNYPIPDYHGNQMMLSIYENNPGSLVKKLRAIYDNFVQNKAKLSGGGASTNADHEKYFVKSNMKDMLTLVHYIMKKEFDPYYLTNYMFSGLNPRPMQTYFRNNLDALLYQMMVGHQWYKPNDSKLSKDMEISSKMMDDVKEYMNKKSHHVPSSRKHSSKRGRPRSSKRKSVHGGQVFPLMPLSAGRKKAKAKRKSKRKSRKH